MLKKLQEIRVLLFLHCPCSLMHFKQFHVHAARWTSNNADKMWKAIITVQYVVDITVKLAQYHSVHLQTPTNYFYNLFSTDTSLQYCTTTERCVSKDYFRHLLDYSQTS